MIVLELLPLVLLTAAVTCGERLVRRRLGPTGRKRLRRSAQVVGVMLIVFVVTVNR